MKIKFCTTLAVSLVTGFSCFSVANAQDPAESNIEIINANGQVVDPAIIAKEPIQKAPVKPKAQVKSAASIQQRNGKIIITDADGDQQEIDVQGAQSVSVSQSTRTVVRDGEQQTETVGKVIVVDADGQRQEFEIGHGAALKVFEGNPIDTQRSQNLPGDFMIGVHCAGITDQLAQQMDIEPGVGLVVAHVAVGSPAATAGILRGDVLMFADDTQLIKPEQLIEAVQRAGHEETLLSLTLNRNGKELGVDVAPAKRAVVNEPALPVDQFPFFDEFGGEPIPKPDDL